VKSQNAILRFHGRDFLNLDESTMKTQLFTLLLCILALLSCRSTKDNNPVAQSFTLSGKIQWQQHYCGGARPEPGMENPKTIPANRQKLYIRQGNLNSPTATVVDSVIADESGNFSITLPQGNYCFIEEWKKPLYKDPVSDKYNRYDTACYRNQYMQCDYSLNLSANTKDINIVLDRPCNWNRPCVQYSGPLPPAAPPTNRGGHQPGHQE
jgi:hypothetical protein